MSRLAIDGFGWSPLHGIRNLIPDRAVCWVCNAVAEAKVFACLARIPHTHTHRSTRHHHRPVGWRSFLQHLSHLAAAAVPYQPCIAKHRCASAPCVSTHENLFIYIVAQKANSNSNVQLCGHVDKWCHVIHRMGRKKDWPVDGAWVLEESYINQCL